MLFGLFEFHVKEGKPVWKEALDQLGHIAYAVILWILIFFPVPGWGAGLLSFAFGILRELEQHNWSFVDMGRQDLFFWGCASFVMTMAYYAIIYF